MENLGLTKILKLIQEGGRPVLNKRFEVWKWYRDTCCSKIYIGLDLATRTEIVVKFMLEGKSNPQFQANYSLLEPNLTPKLLWDGYIEDVQVFVHEMKGKDLQTIFNGQQEKFSSITIAMIFHLIIVALEKLHSKDIIHTNLKPSKILIGKYIGEEQSIFLTGLEVSERISRQKITRTKSEGLKKKKSYENIFSSLNMHSGDNNVSFKDDLESLSYMIINFFTQGRFFKKLANVSKLNKKTRENLIALKTNILSEILLSGIPLEIFDFIKYIFKLKAFEMPNYEYLKGLSLKLCQKFYVKQDVVSCLDWVEVSPEQRNTYRSRMLSYFFCINIPQLKKNKTNKIDDSQGSNKIKASLKPSSISMTTSEFLRKNFQGSPIHETMNESAEITKLFTEKCILDNDDYLIAPQTARLTSFQKVYIAINDNRLRDPNFEMSDQEEDNSSPKLPSSMDSLDEATSERDDEEAKTAIDFVQLTKPYNASFDDLKAAMNQTDTFSTTRSQQKATRLPPSVLAPEPLQYKMFPK